MRATNERWPNLENGLCLAKTRLTCIFNNFARHETEKNRGS